MKTNNRFLLPCLLAVTLSGAQATADGPQAVVDVSIDPTAARGPIKPVNGVNNGPVKARADQCRGNFEAYAAAEIPSARTHDSNWYAGYGNGHVVDISAVFPDFDADVESPASYDFTYTDRYLGIIRGAGAEVCYRLGQSIEHGIKKYNIWPPKDSLKWARICEHIIRHYNEGWANGQRWNIRQWEIWNEPDNNLTNNPTCWGGTDEQFFDFFDVAAKHLKKRFPNLLIGGPAVTGYETYPQRFLEAAKARGTPLDFFSWHGYGSNVYDVVGRAFEMRRLLDANGYGKTASYCTEWNYVRGWSDEWLYTLRAESGDLQMKGASHAMSMMLAFQGASVDLAHYYDARPCGMNGLFHPITMQPMKGYYPFFAFAKLRRLGTEVAVRKTADPEIFAVAARNDRGRLAVVVSRFTNDDNVFRPKTVTVRLAKGSLTDVVCHMTDSARSFTEIVPRVSADGSFTLYLEPHAFFCLEGAVR